MKFSVTVNDSARHVVSAKSFVGAIKATIDSIEADEPEVLRGECVEISARRILPKAAAAASNPAVNPPAVKRGHEAAS